jgi:membrane-bound lytic murein transglycosylase C
MKRRQLIAAAAALPFTSLAYSSDFSDYMSEQENGAKALYTEFEVFQTAYLKEFESYKKDIEKEWDEARTTSPSTWVKYPTNKKSRITLDYRENTVEVAIRSNDQPSPEKIKELLTEAITIPATKAIEQDPVISRIKKKSIPLGDSLMSGIKLAKVAINDLIEQAKTVVDQDSKGEYVKVTVTLPEKAKTDRVRQFLPSVQRYSKEFKIDMPLVLAVIHTESAFNPLAQSHVPAFGLMQIVPNSAGKDVQKLIYKRNQAPTSSMLFKPDVNIQHGCAYLHILNYRYLKAIKNKAAREHCCIAAYNTGAGNVAKAFTGKTNVNSAAKIINRMSADEVYSHLRKNLKYKEARDYVKRVNQYKALYVS